MHLLSDTGQVSCGERTPSWCAISVARLVRFQGRARLHLPLLHHPLNVIFIVGVFLFGVFLVGVFIIYSTLLLCHCIKHRSMLGVIARLILL